MAWEDFWVDADIAYEYEIVWRSVAVESQFSASVTYHNRQLPEGHRYRGDVGLI